MPSVDEVRARLRAEIGEATERDGKWRPMVAAGEVRALLDGLDHAEVELDAVERQRDRWGRLALARGRALNNSRDYFEQACIARDYYEAEAGRLSLMLETAEADRDRFDEEALDWQCRARAAEAKAAGAVPVERIEGTPIWGRTNGFNLPVHIHATEESARAAAADPTKGGQVVVFHNSENGWEEAPVLHAGPRCYCDTLSARIVPWRSPSSST